MSKRRGLSAEEKRERMLALFHEKKDFFLLKEVEKIAFKEKGIVSQSVKDVLQSLVDDDLINSEKIGTSVYFWAFPSNALVTKKTKIEDVSNKVDGLSSKLEIINRSIDNAYKGRKDSPTRSEMLQRLQKLKTRKDQMETKLKLYEDSDPQHLKELKRETNLSNLSANRWTDNTFALHSWTRNNFPSVSISDLNKQFGIPEDLDYIK